MTSLSILIVVHNEEKQLESCLKNLLFGDELVIILDKCTDKSKQISRKFTKKIFSFIDNLLKETGKIGNYDQKI